MKKYLLFLVLSLASLASFGQIDITLSGYPMSTTGWTYNSSTSGTATVIDSTFRITNNGTTSTATYLYYNTPINMAGWCYWVADFDFKITPSTGTIADGFAFWFLTSPPSTSTGSSIGLPANPNGMVLVFDTYDNFSATGPHIPQISLMGYDGTVGTYVETSATGRLDTPLYIQGWIRDGNWHHAKVTYQVGNINVYFDYNTTPSLSSMTPYPISTTAYFGFSGSTGAVTSTQLIKSVNIHIANCLTPGNNGPLCQGDTLMLYAIGDSTNATYSWYGPNGFSSTMQNPIRTDVTYADSGDYHVIKTYGGFSDTEVTHVSIKLTPDVTAGSNSVVCYGATISLTATAPYTGETFSWTGPGTFSSGVQNPTINPASQSDTGWYTVITTLNGCHDTSSVHVDVLRVPIPWDSSNSPICEGNTLLLYSSDSLAGITFSWDGPGGYTSAVQNPTRTSATTAMSGVYTVTAHSGSCVNTDTILIEVDPMPQVPLIVPFTRICSGHTITLIVDPTTYVAGATYYWSGPNGYSATVTGSSTSIPNATTQASGLYSVYAAIGACVTTSTHNNFLVDSTPEAPGVSNNGPICSDSTLKLFSDDNTGGVTFSWTGPALFTSTDQNPVIYNTTTAMSGNYTVTATLGLCNNSSVTTVLIRQTPVNPIVGSNSPVCAGGLLNLSASFTPYTGVFHWTGPNSFTSLLQNPAINNVSTLASGTYWVYEILNGCTSDTVSTEVVIERTPGVPLASSNAPICEGDTLLLFATDTTADVTYSWTGPNAFASTMQNPVIYSITPTGAGIYSVVATLGNCSSLGVTNVNITSTPTVTASSNSPVCSGDTLKLFANAAVGNTFSWSGPYTFSSISPSPTRFPAIMEYAGVYRVTTTEAGGCVGFAYDTVVIKQTPVAPWINWLTYCQYDYAPPLHAVDATSVLWFTSSSGGTGTATAPTPPTDVPGVYFYYLNQTVNGCTSPIDSVQVLVNPKPSITVTPADTSICPRDSIVYRTTVSDLLATVRWTPSTYLSDSVGRSVVAHPEGSIEYFAIATNLSGCSDSAEANVTVYPAALISIPVDDSVTLYPGESYHIQPITNCSYLAWFPPEGLSNPFISDPTAMPDGNTMYIATGVTENGCIARDSVYIHVNADNAYGIPNAFAPDGRNNTFKIYVDGQARLNYFRVFNRWGQLLFETKDISEGWDGTYKGEPQPFAVYVYEIQTVSTISGKIKTLKGNITLIR